MVAETLVEPVQTFVDAFGLQQIDDQPNGAMFSSVALDLVFTRRDGKIVEAWLYGGGCTGAIFQYGPKGRATVAYFPSFTAHTGRVGAGFRRMVQALARLQGET